MGGDGITANANDIALSSSFGNGLSYSSGVLAVGVDDSSIELDSDALQVKASGITNVHVGRVNHDDVLNLQVQLETHYYQIVQ